MSLLRYLTLDALWTTARTQLSETLRDVEAALDKRVASRLVTIAGYLATGATTTRLPLGADTKTARAALLVRASLSREPSTDVAVTPRLNFVMDPGGLQVFEPAGLVANQAYDLTFLVLE